MYCIRSSSCFYRRRRFVAAPRFLVEPRFFVAPRFFAAGRFFTPPRFLAAPPFLAAPRFFAAPLFLAPPRFFAAGRALFFEPPRAFEPDPLFFAAVPEPDEVADDACSANAAPCGSARIAIVPPPGISMGGRWTDAPFLVARSTAFLTSFTYR